MQRNEMTEQEKLARQWAESRLQFDNRSERERAAAEHILATTEPEMPELNRWDGVDMDGREWVVWSVSETGALVLVAADSGAYAHDFAENTTPNGKRYKLVEVSEPDHPEVLSTVEDYENAPRGTVIANYGHFPAIKISDRSWAVRDSLLTSEKLADTYSRLAVLRWGCGDGA